MDEKYWEEGYDCVWMEGYRVWGEVMEKVGVGKWKGEKEDKEDKKGVVGGGY